MRIIHILNTTDQANGMVCAALDLACTQIKMGHKVYVCSGKGGLSRLFIQNGVPHILVNQNRRPFIILAALIKLFQIFHNINPDIVHAHMMTGAVLGACLRPFFNFRLITTVHNEFQRSAILMGLGNKVIAVSEAVRQSMARRGISENSLRAVLNGTINSPRFSNSLPAPYATQRPAVAFVGGLHPRKGVDYLIKAFALVLAEIPAAHLYIIGDGPNRSEYEQLAATIAGGRNIVFCGYLNDPRPYLLGSDIFVLPSLSEPAGLVISEAREVGCAIVASDVGGIPEMIDRGMAGVLVSPKRSDLLAQALLKLMKDPAYLAEMRQKAQLNLDHFSVERVAEETDKVYREALLS